MTSEILSLAKYLASSRLEFSLSEMNQYLDKRYEERELYTILEPHFFDLDLFCGPGYNCTRLIKSPLPADEVVVRELEAQFENPGLPLRIENQSKPI